MPTSPFNLINSAKFLSPRNGTLHVVATPNDDFQNNHQSDSTAASDSANGLFNLSSTLKDYYTQGSFHPVAASPTKGITWYRVCHRDADFISRRDRLRLRAVAETMAQSTEDKKVFPFQRFRIIRLFCHFISSRKGPKTQRS